MEMPVKQDLHPKISTVSVKCAGCNRNFEIVSAYKKEVLHVEFCSHCHPAYTGKRKIATQGAIERLKKRYGDNHLTSTDLDKS